MNYVADNADMIKLLKLNTQQKLIDCARNAGIPLDMFLNKLIDNELKRQHQLNISDKIIRKETKQTISSQKIIKICNQYLSGLNSKSENIEIQKAIEQLHENLLRQNLLSVKTRTGCIVESKPLKTSRLAYYSYSSILAKHTAMWFSTLEIYLWHKLLHPISEIVFIGMPANVEVCYQVFTYLYPICKKNQIAYKIDAGIESNAAKMKEKVNRNRHHFARELEDTQASIENNNYNKPLYDYIDKKFAYVIHD